METILLGIEAFTAIFFMGLAIPLILRKIPPNNLYGVRVKKTLTNEDVWYKANAYFGKDFLLASLTVLLACVALYFMKDRMKLNTFLLTASTVLVVPYFVLVVPYFVPVVRTLLYLRKL